jgi:hypothetical protein
MGKIIGVVLGVVILAIMFPIFMDSLTDSQTELQLDLFPGCVVAGGETDVVLTQDLFKDRTAHITEMTSDDPGATPVATTYVPATNTLTIGGLGAVTPQDITVTYRYDITDDYTGLGEFMGLTPLLIWLGIIFALIGGVFLYAKSRG